MVNHQILILRKKFKNFDNKPKEPSVYPRGSDGYQLESEVKFYNQDSLWTRWRRGYELYNDAQQILGSTSKERDRRGDYRLFFTFQQFLEFLFQQEYLLFLLQIKN